MDETILAGRCPRCGKPLPTDASEGLCAACLLGAAAGDVTYSTIDEAPTIISTPRASTVVAGEGPRLETGQPFGPYRIGRLLGRGGMGEVYEAEHADTGRRLALKVLRGQIGDREDRARFLREGQLAASVSHPHTVYIFGSEEIGGMPVITMELLPGGTLKDLVIDRGPMPPADAVAAVLDIVGGLDAAHAAGILHRDIKPSNCFTTIDGTVKVGDFGLSISTLARDVKASSGPQGFEGTPQFAPPEQLRGQPLDVRADIYAVGATLYYLLTGQPPFDARDLRELVSKVTTEAPRSPRELRPNIPAPVAAIVLQCLAKDPQARPASYAILADALRPFAAGAAVPAPLGLRTMAGVVDSILLSFPFSVSSAVTVQERPGSGFHATAPVNWWALAFSLAYYIVAEGRWAASIGKRVFGLRVMSASGGVASWTQIIIRSSLSLAPAAPVLIAVILFGREGVANYLTAHPAFGVIASISPMFISAAFFLTMRRRNGMAAVQDLLSGTRVVVRPTAALRRGLDHTRDEAATAPAATPLRLRCGPFDVTSDLGQTPGGRLLVGFDALLRRPVWILASPTGTPPVSETRRDLGRVGRLHWLAGRRSAAENWDAFEAPDGQPLRSVRRERCDWTTVKTWLMDLSTELAASEREGSTPALDTAHVWIRSDGRAVLLDFPAPATRPEAAGALTPVGLLAEVRRLIPSEAPMPLSAVALLQKWTRPAGTTIEDAKAELARAAAAPDRLTRWRRLLPIVLCALPVLILLAASAALIPAFNTAMSRDRLEMMSLLGTIDAADKGKANSAKDPEHRRAIETYLVGRFGRELADDRTWTNIITSAQSGQLRPAANRLLAAPPDVSGDAMARATATITPDLDRAAANYAKTREAATQGPRVIALALMVISAAFSMACSLISAIIVPGGVGLRLMGYAVVNRAGVEIGRWRSVARVLIAWSPVGAWLIWLRAPVPAMRQLFSASASPAVIAAVVVVLLLGGVVWIVLRPTRGPHDWIAGTSIVPR